MTVWLISNIGTILAVLIVAVIIGLAVFSVVRSKRKGKSSCGCGCEHCAMAGSCHNSK